MTGSVVKGLVAHATVELFRLDTAQPEFYDATAAIAQGYSDANGMLQSLEIARTESGPWILVADGRNGIDLTSGQTPVITRLINVVTQDMLASGSPVYATTLTTLAFHMARMSTPSDATSDAFLSALTTATGQLKSVLGIELPDEVDILTSPPLLTDAASTESAQHAVAQHRAALEGVAAIVYALAASSSADANVILEALARDLQSDGVVDAADNGLALTGLDVAVLGADPADLLVPNTDIPVLQVTTLLQRDQDYLPANITIVQNAVAVVTNTTMLNVAITSTPTDPPAAPPILTLSWDPSTGVVSGYRVYAGPAPDEVSQLVRSLVLADGVIDPSTPASSFDTASDLGVQVGDPLCFRVKAYNDAGESEFSEPICTTV